MTLRGDHPVAIVGGGIVGLSCAYHLARRGVPVTVFERGRFGAGASWGNAGLLTPSLCAPIPGPGALALGLRSLRDREATIALRPTASASKLLWLARFARHCTSARHLRGLDATARLSRGALAAYDELVADDVRLTMREAPLVFAFADASAAEHLAAELRAMQAYGHAPPSMLDGDELRRVEPLLSEGVRAGFVVAGERFVDPATVTAGLVERLRAMSADLREGCEVTAITTGAGACSIQAGGESARVDAVVIAAGADSRRVARMAGIRLPVEGGKGYSVSVAIDGAPQGPIGLWEPKIACTPIGGRLRLTGGMELGAARAGVDRAVIDRIVRVAGRYIRTLDAGSAREAWSGMRPMLPTGLPVIGPARGKPRIHVATGHSTLGMTLGPLTGRLLAEQIVEGRLHPALAPFAP
jgi:D-amino-acid dehydrogenase